MRDTVNQLTVAIAFISIWLVSISVDGVLAGIAVWVFIAALYALLTWYSIRTRWFIGGAVRPLRLEDEHKTSIMETERRPSATTADGRNSARRNALRPSINTAERFAVARMLDEGCPNVQPMHSPTFVGSRRREDSIPERVEHGKESGCFLFPMTGRGAVRTQFNGRQQPEQSVVTLVAL